MEDLSGFSFPPLRSTASSNVAVNDEGFKPKLLRSLLKELVPDENYPFTNPSGLSHVVTAVKTHDLLSEYAVDQNLMSNWKSAIDAWVSRLAALISSQTMEDLSGFSFPPLRSTASSNVAVNDEGFKPKLLRSLLKELVPDENYPFTNPSGLSHVVTAVKTHDLLSEYAVDQNLMSNWKFAIDAWVSRLAALISSQTPDKVWAAICLLGLTFQECNSERFLASYKQWFNSIFTHIQNLSDSPFLRAASFASMSDLFTRLGGFPNERKNGGSLAAKLVQPVLKLVNEDSSQCELEEALSLLCKIINVYPISVGRHYNNVEASIFSRFISEHGSINLFKKLGHCLILLPRSRGTVDSWTLMMQKIILFLNDQLTFAFQGLEKETARNEVFRLTVLPGRDPPPPLGGLTSRYSRTPLQNPEQVLVSRVCILMSCCGMMLTSSYPVQVPVPARPLMALIKRVLMVDGSYSPPSQLMTMTRHEFICSELPTLHACSLDLLRATFKGLRSQSLPHVAGIAHMLTDYLGICSLPEPRIKVYSVLRAMLLSMGVGVAMLLVDVVLHSAFIDLDSSMHERSGSFQAPDPKVSEKAPKRRKHAASTSSSLEDNTPAGGLAIPRYRKPAPISVRIAALEVLEALLTVAGAVRSDDWRSKVDHLLLAVALNACKGVPAYDEATPIWQDLQLAALRALLASLLSPGRACPLHLAQSLELFRKGAQVTGTNIAEYCQSAVLALEAHIQPRAPLIDLQAFADDCNGANLKPPEICSSDNGKNTPSFIAQAQQPSQRQIDDDLVASWMVNDETEAGLGSTSRTDGEPSRISDYLPVGELFPGYTPSSVARAADAVAEDDGAYMQLQNIDLNIGFEESDMLDNAFYATMEQTLAGNVADPASTSTARHTVDKRNAEKGKGVANRVDITAIDSDSE